MSSALRTPWSSRVKKCRIQFASKRNQAIRREIVRELTEGTVLEVGAGTKEFKKHVKDRKYVGADFTPEFEPDVLANAENLPFSDDSFENVCTKNCLQHISSYERALSEIIRVALRRIILAERVWNKPTQIVSKTPVLRRRFDPDDLIRPLEEFGEVKFNLSKADERVGIVCSIKRS